MVPSFSRLGSSLSDEQMSNKVGVVRTNQFSVGRSVLRVQLVLNHSHAMWDISLEIELPILFYPQTQWKISPLHQELKEFLSSTFYLLAKSKLGSDFLKIFQKIRIFSCFFHPQEWDPLMLSFPYYSPTTPIRIPKDMGMVWVPLILRGCHYWGSLESPLI